MINPIVTVSTDSSRETQNLEISERYQKLFPAKSLVLNKKFRTLKPPKNCFSEV